MSEIWLYSACLLLNFVGGLIFCGLYFAIGGMGVYRRRLNALEIGLADQEGKTLKIQKKIASEASQVRRQEKLSNQDLLQQLEFMKMQENGGNTPVPSVINE